MLKKLLMIAGILTTVAIVAESISESIDESEKEERKALSVLKKIPTHIAFKIIFPISDELDSIVRRLTIKISSWKEAACETA